MSSAAASSPGTPVPRRPAAPPAEPLRVVPAALPRDAPAPPSPDARLDVSVVLPCYDEEGHVLAEVERIVSALETTSWTWEVVCVDDGSTDRTRELLAGAAQADERVRLLALPRNAGSGTARRVGTQHARGEVVVWTDADMSYPNELIPSLVEMLREDPLTDQVVGARTSEQGTHRFARVPAKWAVRKLAEVLTETRIPDLNSGLRAFRREVSLPYLRLLPAGFSCVTTLTVSFLANHHPVRYVPVPYARRAGRSKFHWRRDVYLYLLQVLRMVMYFNPLKVLMPVALGLLGLAAAKLGYDWVTNPFRVPGVTVILFVVGVQTAVLALLADLVVRSRPDG